MKTFVLSGGGNLLRALWPSVSLVTRLGLGLAAVGVLADVIHHVFTHDLHAVEALNIGAIGHILTLAGMVLAMSGVIGAAAASRRRHPRQKGERNAARCCSAAPR
jgi:hypothetical protein